ncbi:MAG TPA: zinc ribbon domain-containing protein [Gemmatimonadales bacterium]
MALIPDEFEQVTKLFRCLVDVLANSEPQRLHSTFEISELYQRILPYRRFRSELGFDTNEDYEMALLRLLAGDGGLASVEPEEVQAALAREAAQRNPDPGAFREYAGAAVRLSPAAVEHVLHADRAYAPPETGTPHGFEAASPPFAEDPAPTERAPEVVEPAPPLPTATRPVDPVFELEPVAPAPPPTLPSPAARRPSLETPACRSCGRGLPLHRDVVYCPFCGKLAHTPACARCGAAVETGWRFCVECGEPAVTH